MVYCDIPYLNTNCGKYKGFDHDSFYEWAEKQDNIFISEYSMSDNFIEFASIKKQVLSSKKGSDGVAHEKLFTNKRTFEKYNGIICDKQLPLF